MDRAEQLKDAVEPTGKEAVRLYLVQRLAGSGLRPPKGLTEAQHAEAMKRLVEYLAYLSRPSLEALADQILQAAGGRARDLCPSELVIRQMAEALERRPFEQAPIIASWLASVEGPKAEAGGYLAQLYRHLRAHPRPILPYDLKQIHQQAAEDRRREALLCEREHLVTDEERHWRAELAEDLRRARDIIARGQSSRAARQQGAAA